MFSKKSRIVQSAHMGEERRKHHPIIEGALNRINPDRNAEERIQEATKQAEDLASLTKGALPQRQLELGINLLHIGFGDAIHAIKSGYSEKTALRIAQEYSNAIRKALNHPEE